MYFFPRKEPLSTKCVAPSYYTGLLTVSGEPNAVKVARSVRWERDGRPSYGFVINYSRPNLLTTIIVPLALTSNWSSILQFITSYLVAMILLEILLLIVFAALDGFLFYIFFESILPPAEWSEKSLLRDKLPNIRDILKFLIPSYIWKYVSGWSNYSGMVISQKMT